MRHTLHIMLGEKAMPFALGQKQYVIKNGNPQENSFFRTLLYREQESGDGLFSEAKAVVDDGKLFDAGIDGMYATSLSDIGEIKKDFQQNYLCGAFESFYSKQITINNPGDSPQGALQVCLYVPLYDVWYWNTAKEMLTAMHSLTNKFCVDVVLLADDLTYLYETDRNTVIKNRNVYHEQSLKTIQQITDFQQELNVGNSSIVDMHVILMQNCNASGTSLNLDAESFCRIAGELALISVCHYADAFRTGADGDRNLFAFGLSVLNFDKSYVVQYLLHRTYVHILDREFISQKKVDVNKIAPVVKKILQANTNIFSRFYEEKVKPKLLNGVRQDVIVQEAYPMLEKEIARITEECLSFINDPRNLNLPEKQATLAHLLGVDDSLFDSYLFDKNQLVVDDCINDAVDFFIEANNQMLATGASENGDEGEDNKPKAKSKEDLSGYAVLSQKTGLPVDTAKVMGDKLKKLQMEIRESTALIRKKTAEVEGIDEQMLGSIESQKRFTENGFVFAGRTYPLESEDNDAPLNDDFEPKQVVLPQKMDLRGNFTPIRNHTLRASSVYAVVSIYEYLLKKNKQSDPDLSENFVYFNVRNAKGTAAEDSGCSMSDAIASVAEYGVCLEKFCPSDDVDFAIRPSEVAFEDAKGHKIVKALNVRKRLHDIKAALHEGYPVAISLRIFDSFYSDSSFIDKPSEKTISEDNSGSLGMVICGYNDADEVFIVRNSWGTSFGEDGYCYIDYSYIEDERLLKFACIIKEVNNDQLAVAGNDGISEGAYQMAQDWNASTIIRQNIKVEKRKLESSTKNLVDARAAYENIIQSLGNNAIRSKICEGLENQLDANRQAHQEACDNTTRDRIRVLDDLDQKSKNIKISFAKVWLAIVAVFAVLCKFIGILDVLTHDVSFIVYVAVFISVVVFAYQLHKIAVERKEQDEDFAERIKYEATQCENIKREKAEIRLKAQVAGLIIDKMSDMMKQLKMKYNSISGFVGNLKEWREEEGHLIKEMVPVAKDPFLSLISNSCLDKYFDQEREEISKNTFLYEMFKDRNEISDKQVVQFKRDLKKKIVDTLFKAMDKFNIYDYVVRQQDYPYLSRLYYNEAEMLSILDNKSLVFLNKNNAAFATSGAREYAAKSLFICNNENQKVDCENICAQSFQKKPAVCVSHSRLKITAFSFEALRADEIAMLKKSI